MPTRKNLAFGLTVAGACLVTLGLYLELGPLVLIAVGAAGAIVGLLGVEVE